MPGNASSLPPLTKLSVAISAESTALRQYLTATPNGRVPLDQSEKIRVRLHGFVVTTVTKHLEYDTSKPLSALNQQRVYAEFTGKDSDVADVFVFGSPTMTPHLRFLGGVANDYEWAEHLRKPEAERGDAYRNVRVVRIETPSHIQSAVASVLNTPTIANFTMINYTDLKAPPQRTLKLTSDTIQISAFDPFESQRAPLPAPAAQVSLSGNASFEPEDLIDQVVILKEGQTPPPGKIAVYLRKRPQTYSQLPKPYSVPVTTYPEQIDDHRYALKKVKEALFKEEVKRVEDEEYGQTEEAQRYLKTLRGNVQFLQQTLDSVLRLRQEATLTRATELLDLEAAPESKRGKIDSEEQLEDHTSVYLRFINQQY